MSILQDIMDGIEADQKKLGYDPKELYIVLSDDKDWLESLYETSGPDVAIRAASNEQQFQALLKFNPEADIVVALKKINTSTLVWAYEMGLRNVSNNLIFASTEEPSGDGRAAINSLGGLFIRKDSNFWENIQIATVNRGSETS